MALAPTNEVARRVDQAAVARWVDQEAALLAAVVALALTTEVASSVAASAARQPPLPWAVEVSKRMRP